MRGGIMGSWAWWPDQHTTLHLYWGGTAASDTKGTLGRMASIDKTAAHHENQPP